ncbi:MAG: PilX N-terminal domain-containing pilus assembly protein [Myxococcota bacterium]
MTHMDTHKRLTGARDESGMALLIAVIVLLLMSALGLAALQHAGDEASGSGRARRKDATLYAADSGLEMIQEKLFTSYVASATMAPVDVDQLDLVTDGYGNPIAVRSGAPANGGLPAVKEEVQASSAPAQIADGYSFNTGSSNSQNYRPAQADVTALDVANGMVHLQAQFRLHEGPEVY